MFSSFQNVHLAGFTAAVPENCEKIADLMERSEAAARFTLKRVAALAGLKQRHVAPEAMFTGDLALAAGAHLLQKLDWAADSVDMLFFVTQTPDFLSPPTGYLIAAALGLSHNCAIMDLTSGCPGMIQGAWLASGQLNSENRRAIILSGDASSKVVPGHDTGNRVLMGDAVGALALEYVEGASSLAFNLLSFPDTAFSLVNYNSGYRPVRNNLDGMVMDGNKVTEFCLARAPECIEGLLKREGLDMDEVDMFYLHQPNKMILDTLCRRLKMDRAKVPMIFSDYANCSSASLPISVCRAGRTDKTQKAIFCAFGSGLSVSAMLAEWNPANAFGMIKLPLPALMAKTALAEYCDV